MIKAQDLLQMIEHSVRKIVDSDSDDVGRINDVYRLFSYALMTLGAQEQLHFSTLFARIAFLANRYQVPSNLTRMLHVFRIESERTHRQHTAEKQDVQHNLWKMGAYALLKVAAIILKAVPDQELLARLEDFRMPESAGQRKTGFERHLRIVARHFDPVKNHLTGWVENQDEEVVIDCNDPGRSDFYRDQIEKAIELTGLPMTLSLINSEIDEDQVISPASIVIEPDFLVDVTAIAECFKEDGADSRYYVLNKYLPREVRMPILLGNTVNYFLDELVHDPAVSFETLIPDVFKLSPVAFSTLSDTDVWELVKKAQTHFENLQRTLREDFVKQGIDPKASYIEPSFYVPTFGLQGRLDLYQPADGNNAYIVELKSGRPFRPNAYGLSSTHYAQTLLYDLMIRAVCDFSVKPAPYLLYSSLHDQSLRYAPPVYALQREAIKLRNEIFLIERMLQSGRQEQLFELIRPDQFPGARGFVIENIRQFHSGISKLDSTEQAYFHAFASFIAGEQYMAKVGVRGSDRNSGLAGLWLDPLYDKEEHFNIIKGLKLDDIDDATGNSTVRLLKGGETNPLANFRVGDIAVLYPADGQQPSVLFHQIFKCTVVSNEAEHIEVRLRNKQVNDAYLRQHKSWVIEHDVLDSSFNAMHRGLFAFARFARDRRELFLGRRAPARPRPPKDDFTAAPANVRAVLQRMVAADDYFLLWGPPGTGKTSVVLHHLVRYYLEYTDEKLLVMAYTNRAVDEICHAIEAIGGDVQDQYLRIGSRAATGAEFRGQLLSDKLQDISNRKQLITLLKGRRIIVSTISSMTGKLELLDILSISTVIIDEASQILEPMLAGLLPRFSKWMLIGDHQQLPAVVAQPQEHTAVSEPDLRAIGLHDRRTSFFERMYLRCIEKQWDWATGQLSEQGRMHAEIMDFPGRVFYDGHLSALDNHADSGRDLQGPLNTGNAGGLTELERALADSRMLFLPVQADEMAGWSKTNDAEAGMCVEVVSALDMIYQAHEQFPSIGIITPFRAQIANIRDHLLQAGIDVDRYTIDTVERYQGSARDIVILSLCIQHSAQLDTVISLSDQGVDRKLNVAVTRAREQFICIASPDVVKYNALYKALTDACRTVRLQPLAQT